MLSRRTTTGSDGMPLTENSRVPLNLATIPLRALSKKVLSSHMKVLSEALKTYSKKTGAGIKSTLPETARAPSAMGALLGVTNECIHMLQDILSERGGKVLYSFINMLAAQFERLVTNILRLLNDRASMLCRKNCPYPMESSCNLHQDIVLTSVSCSKFISVVDEWRTAMLTHGHVSPRAHTSPITTILTAIQSRIKVHTSKTFPTLQRRVEAQLTGKLSLKVTAIGDVHLTSKSFREAKGQGGMEMGLAVRDQIMVPLLECLKVYCTSHSSIERIMTVSSNCCVNSLLHYVKEKRLLFNELGVVLLHAQLDCLLQWLLVAKEQLGYAPSSPIILDVMPWHKANGIINVLLAATGGCSDALQAPSALGESSSSARAKMTRHLSIFEQERWAELGQSPKWACVSIRAYNMFRKRRSTVSISLVLDIKDL